MGKYSKYVFNFNIGHNCYLIQHAFVKLLPGKFDSLIVYIVRFSSSSHAVIILYRKCINLVGVYCHWPKRRNGYLQSIAISQFNVFRVKVAMNYAYLMLFGSEVSVLAQRNF